jgi:hypothetical protein
MTPLTSEFLLARGRRDLACGLSIFDRALDQRFLAGSWAAAKRALPFVNVWGRSPRARDGRAIV